MRLGVKGLKRLAKPHAGVVYHAEPAPFAVALDTKHRVDRLLRRRVARVRHHAAVLVFHATFSDDALFNQHQHAL